MTDTDNGNEKCLNCNSEDIIDCHADATYAIPETTYKACCDCNHQWGYE